MASNEFDVSLVQYLQSIRRVPVLSAEEEYRLAKELREQGSDEASSRLVTSHLRLVVAIAGRYRGYKLPIAELISEGSVGMLEALKRFDPDRGFRLATYAQWWIRAAIQDYIMRSFSLVKIGTTRAQKRTFYNLRRLKAQRGTLSDGDLSSEHAAEISAILGVSKAELIEMNGRLAGRDHSLNGKLGFDDDGEWQDHLIDESDDQEHELAEREEFARRRMFLAEALKKLSERERQIVVARRLNERPPTLRDLTHQFAVSPERVRQIENNAVEKLRRAVVEAGAA